MININDGMLGLSTISGNVLFNGNNLEPITRYKWDCYDMRRNLRFRPLPVPYVFTRFFSFSM